MKAFLSREPLKLNSKFILPLSMLFITASVAADSVAYKITAIGPGFASGASVIFPLTYLLGDVITEVYGYSVNRILIWSALFCEIVFSLCVHFVSNLPLTNHFPFQDNYSHVFNNILWFIFSGVLADIVSNFLNSYCVSKWKIKFEGKLFWIRSISATLISQLAQAIIICPLAFYNVSSKMDVIKIMATAYVIEVFYAFIFVWFAMFLIYYLKKREGRDAYDVNVNYNPFKFD